ncbi:DNA-binding winged helix-turn-helix (wHTH) protein/Tol biopolymer transport system component [Rheinheimera pacifica]|uniref:winged helix-turn-helix domain-containing protein n=1 Tax=Rheinheimera pacifica TaxID=173990 RepID=UPI00285C9455|nr:winged helix-turn-helix domain-containing protein [Rheinheimera pacifica]MDR6985354.1 DNA-binding winged helix-turn-helix (wHTH) protein/Tol biopolymer transport system component [Rheinheimera pacifica]
MDTMQLGPWTFTPADFSINDGAQRKELEPLLIKLLLCFAREPGRIVSRQELVDTIWQQSYVDDNAINRAISELRKALQHPDLSQSPIKTHHRKGYSLQLPVPIANGKTAATVAPTVNSKRKHALAWWLAVSTAVVSAIAVVVYQFTAPAPSANNTTGADKLQVAELAIISQQKVTWFKGIESRPLVSPDKQLLAYSHSQSDGKIRVMVRKLGISAGNTLQEVALEGDDKLYSLQTWQPQSRNLLLQVVNKDGSNCEYQNYDFSQYPQYQVTRLTQCNGLVLGTAQVSADGQWLYYSKGSGGMYSSNALLAENLNSGTIQTLVAAPSAGFGVTLLALSADGSQLAYSLMPESNQPDIYLYDPSSREHRRVASLPFPLLLLALEWSPDQSSLLLPGGDAILQLNIRDKSRRLLKLPDGIKVGELSLLSDDKAYVSALTAGSTTQNAMQLVKISQPFDAANRQISFLHDAAGSALAMAVSPVDASRYAFSANWTGGWQLWLNQHGENIQLTELISNEQPINSISWSGDGRYIAFVKKGNLYLYDTQRQQLITKMENNDIGQPVWLPDDSGLVLTRIQGNSQNLWQLDLISNELSQLTFSAGSFAQYNANGQLLYHRDGKLYQYGDGAKQDIELNSSSDSNLMAIWLHQGQRQYRYSMLGHIEQHDASTGVTQQTQLPYQVLALHPDPHNPDQLYATVFVTPELALEFIQWQVATAD